MTWSRDQLQHVENGDDFKIAPYRPDGRTPGTLIWVWAVVVDDAVFVRSTNPASRWFAAALTQRAGIVESDNVQHAVQFEHVTDPLLQDRVDEEFARKYAADPYFSPDVLDRSRARIARVTVVVPGEEQPSPRHRR